MLAVLGLGCGLSPFFDGLYSRSTWGPIALGVLALLFGALVARWPEGSPRVPAFAAISGLAALAVWSLLSIAWSESANGALLEANRWLLYAALFGLLLVLLRDVRLGLLLVGGATVGILGVAGYVVVTMLLGNGPSLFAGSRLSEPLGYVNGQAGFFLAGLWPLVALAEQTSRRAVSAGAVAGLVLLGGLVVMSQSRGAMIALGLSALVVLFVPGRGHRLWIIVVVSAAVALATNQLLEIGRTGDGLERPSADALRGAMETTLFLAVAAGLSWWAITSGLHRFAERDPRVRGRLVSLSTVGLGAVAAVTIALAVSLGHPVERVEAGFRAFTKTEDASSPETGYLSRSENRHDFWRVALHQFRDHPVRGIGAGNYVPTYFLLRRTREHTRQPHSIELQLLAELGVVGGVALVVFSFGVFAGFRIRSLRGRTHATSAALAVAGGGVFTGWLVQTSVDWLHNLPGLTGVALCGGAALVAPRKVTGRREAAAPLERPGRIPRSWPRLALIALAAIATVAAAWSIARPTMADRYRSQGQEALPHQPRTSIAKAEKSLSLNDEALDSYYLGAAAYARLDRYEEARDALLAAARREPHNFVPWGLLGDLAVRRGDLAAARRHYVRASELNPRDIELVRLARKPRLAKQLLTAAPEGAEPPP
jgi:hypothetical protein